MDGQNAIWNGGLASNQTFFGASFAEVASAAITLGGWHEDRVWAANSTNSWYLRGGNSNIAIESGILTSGYMNGGVRQDFTHRAILSGY